MLGFYIIDADSGAILRAVQAESLAALTAGLEAHEIAKPAEPGIYPETHYLDLVTSMYRPLDLSPDLGVSKAAQRAYINAERDRLKFGFVDTPYGPFDSNLVSLVAITGAVTTGIILQARGEAMPPINWTRYDNTSQELDMEALGNVGLLIVAQQNVIHQRALVLKARIEAAETLQEVYAVVWSMADAAA